MVGGPGLYLKLLKPMPPCGKAGYRTKHKGKKILSGVEVVTLESNELEDIYKDEASLEDFSMWPLVRKLGMLMAEKTTCCPRSMSNPLPFGCNGRRMATTLSP